MDKNDLSKRETKKKLLKFNFRKILTALLFILIVTSFIVLNFYLVKTKNTLEKNLIETTSYVKKLENKNMNLANRPKLSPDILYSTRRYHEVEIDSIEDFFDNTKYNEKAIKYLINKDAIEMGNTIDMKCTEEYTSGYRGYDAIKLYIDIPDNYKNYDEMIKNADNYKLEDDFLVSFIDEKNKKLSISNPESIVRDISKCTTKDNRTIISYTISTSSEKSLFIEYFKEDNKSKEQYDIDKIRPLFGCSTKPFVFTSNRIAYYMCGYGDAGTHSRSIYRIDFNKETSEEILNCISQMVLAIDAPPPDIHCWEPYK